MCIRDSYKRQAQDQRPGARRPRAGPGRHLRDGEAPPRGVHVTDSGRDTMNVVIVGHVDHGKSTLVGRLLADTGTLGDGKLEKVQETCRRQGKTFEYAFLLDALEEEQGQGITIDAARVFFRTALRATTSSSTPPVTSSSSRTW